MSSVLWRFAAIAFALCAALAIAAGSHIRLQAHSTGDAVLRVAFSARPERVERCRTLSAQELADIPEHMQQPVECVGSTARYRLEVLRDDVRLTTAELRGGGLRHDRQLYVLRDLAIPSGRSIVEVHLTRIDSVVRKGEAHEDSSVSLGEERRHEAEARDSNDETRSGAPNRRRREADERRRRIGGEIPASLALRETVYLSPREVMLVTYDQGARRLRVVRRKN